MDLDVDMRRKLMDSLLDSQIIPDEHAIRRTEKLILLNERMENWIRARENWIFLVRISRNKIRSRGATIDLLDELIERAKQQGIAEQGIRETESEIRRWQ